MRSRDGLTYRGVNYDTGTDYRPLSTGTLSRRHWNTRLMRSEIRAIKRELHCNSLGVHGTDIDRLVETSTTALDEGLHLWLQPRLFDHPQHEILDHLAETARRAERLRKEYGRINLNVGVEFSIFAPGMIPGDNFLERAESLQQPELAPALYDKLNTFLGQTLSVARSYFNGAITYSSGPWEDVDWSDFDLIGLDYYYPPSFDRAAHVANLRRFRGWNKPIAIVEFGMTTSGASPFIVDWSQSIPQITGPPPANDEQAQADHLIQLLDIFEAENLHAALVFEFIETEYPYSPYPRFDLDRASYGIAKVMRRDYEDPVSPYRWHPKPAFHALARHNGAHGRAGPQSSAAVRRPYG